MDDPTSELIRLVGFAGLTIGLLLNLPLLFLAYGTRNDKTIGHYSHIVFFCSLQDIGLSLEQLFSQHSLIITDGKLLILPYGPERLLCGSRWTALSFAFHIFFPVMCTLSLPAFFHYRYVIISGEPSLRYLAKRIALAAFFSANAATSAALAISVAHSKGLHHYDDVVRNATGLSALPPYYVMDSRQPLSMFFSVGGTVGPIVATILVIFYGWKSWRYLNKYAADSQQTARTKQLQRQFARCLITQTVASIAFAVCPVFFITTNVVMGNYIRSAGTLLFSELLPAVNVLLTFSMVTAYRKALRRSATHILRKSAESHASTSITPAVGNPPVRFSITQ